MATTSATSFRTGDKVYLHGLSARPELNGAAATIVNWHEDAQRYSVRLENAERVRVRAANLSTERPSAGDAEKDASPAPPSPTAIDATLYVGATGGGFIMPGVPAPPAGQPELSRLETAVVHRVPLPAGHWEVRALEQDAVRASVTATLVAVRRDDASHPTASAWNELAGLTITREVLAAEGEDAASADVAASVEASMLTLHIPLTHPKTAAPVPHAACDRPAVARAASADTPPAAEWDVDDKENDAAAGSDDAATGAWWDAIEDLDLVSRRSKTVRVRPPAFVRRSVSLGGGPTRRSRKNAQARRRALSARSDAQRCAYDKARADPLWKAERSHVAAVGA